MDFNFGRSSQNLRGGLINAGFAGKKLFSNYIMKTLLNFYL